MNTAALQYFSQITRDLSPEQFHRLLNIIKEIVAVMRWPSLWRHLRIEIWTFLYEIPIKSEGVFFGIKKSTAAAASAYPQSRCLSWVSAQYYFQFRPYAVYWKGWCSSLLKNRAANIPFWKWCKVKSWGLYRNRLQKPENGAGEAMQSQKLASAKRKAPYFLRSTVLFYALQSVRIYPRGKGYFEAGHDPYD